MKNYIYLKLMPVLVLMLLANGLYATNYWCDPVTGSMSNAGTAASPWGMLQSVFSANKVFAAGDTIFLRSGYHGFPQVKGINTGTVYIMPEAGQVPTAKKIKVNAAAWWNISGFQISPEFAGIYEKGDLVEITSSASYTTIRNCYMFSVASMAGIDSLGVRQKFASGIQVNGPNTVLYNNTMKEVGNGITIAKTAKFAQVTFNTVHGFTNDGMRGLADSCNFEYNIVKVCYGLDDNHDDGFQSWSVDATGAVGKGTVYNVVLRGNIFISQTDVNQPFQQERGMQGTGNFDGFFENWIIENNLIVSDMYEGISLYGAKNCKIINNTVVKSPFKPGAFTPWIKVAKHKNGTNSTGNIVRNNFTSDMSDMNGVTQSNNIESQLYALYFVNYDSLDLHLKTTSPAINAGSSLDAPAIDLEQNPRNAPVDIGAYEYAAGQLDTQAPTVPGGVQIVSTSLRTATVKWNSSTDNLGVAGYKIYMNGANPVKVISPDTSASFKGLQPGTAYNFTVSALDAAPNESAQSAEVTGITQTGYTPSIVRVAASSFETGSTNVPANAIDNNLATRWTSVGNGEWIWFELDTVYHVTAVGAAFFNGHIRSTYFEAEASADAVNWTKISPRCTSAGNSTAIEEFDVTNTYAKYIRYIGYGNSGNATTAPYNSVTEFRVYSLDTFSTSLPVALLSFAGRTDAGQIRLNWTTASEQNSHYFEIQRSADGRHFTTTGRVQAKGNSSVKSDYFIYDKNPVKGLNYYRLLQYDLDGKHVASNVVIINFGGRQTTFSVFPNPVKDVLYVSAAAEIHEEATLTLRNAAGSVVLAKQFKAGQQVFAMPLEGRLAAGVYLLSVVAGAVHETVKVIVR